MSLQDIVDVVCFSWVVQDLDLLEVLSLVVYQLYPLVLDAFLYSIVHLDFVVGLALEIS